MNIRSYSQSHRHACLEILESNTPEFFIPTDCDGYATFLDDLPAPYFVLEQFGQIAACGGWALDTAGVADLTWGMVRRRFHRRGLGRELLRFRLNAIRNDGRATLVRVRTAQLVQGFFVREDFRLTSCSTDLGRAWIRSRWKPCCRLTMRRVQMLNKMANTLAPSPDARCGARGKSTNQRPKISASQGVSPMEWKHSYPHRPCDTAR